MGSERVGENAENYHAGHVEEPFTRYPGNPILTSEGYTLSGQLGLQRRGGQGRGRNNLLLMRVSRIDAGCPT